MTPQELKNSILQLAIQGKLVEQRPEEGTAEELLIQITLNDNVDGQRVKQKVITRITDDEKIYGIPENCGVNWIKIGDTEKNGKYISSTAEKIKPSGVSKSRMVHAGDFLLTNSMSFGRPYILKIDGCIHDGWLVISPINKIFDQDYLYWMLSSNYAYIQFCGKVSGAVVKNLNSDKVANSVFPLPPLAEQKRIVEKIQELMPLVDRYEQSWSKLEQLNSRFPEDMKKSLLQYAVQGKLVEQREEEGTAQELFKEIQKEKQRLIKDGKIKKEKPLPEITDDEKPFDIPDNWKWCRLGSIISISSGDGLTSKEMSESGIYPVYGGNGINGHHNFYNISKRTLVIGRVGFYCGSTHITESKAWVTDNAFITTFDEDRIDMKWLKFYIDYLNPRKKASSTAQPVISGKLIYPMLVPLPPLAEQKRIVEKLEQLLPLCDRLK